MNSSLKSATIKKEIVPLLTYPFSDPSPVPEFGRLYPYNRFDGYTDKGTMQDWEMIVLENDHIKLWVNPSVGGKIWGAIEKRTGKDFIYFNHVAKFRDVAMRGPWTAGGMEFNIGIIGHAPSCSAPMDHFIRENADGSVSCFIGATDWPSRTNWMVEILLPADTAYFTTRTMWYNSSRLEQSYYQWNNIGVKAAGNLEYVNPGNQRIGHDGKALSWPVDEQGRQISWYDRNDFAEYRSYHIFGTYSDFWGCYWHNDRFGFGTSSAYDDKPGKKIWIWGLSRYGMIWEDLLTDNDGQYTEVQSGRMFNQSISASSRTPFKHGSFTPYVHDHWDEHWFPVSGIDGLTYGGSKLSFYIDGSAEQSVLQMVANQPLSGEIRVAAGQDVLVQKHIQLDTLQREDLTLPKGGAKDICLYFNDQLLYDGPTVHRPLKRPSHTPADVDHHSVHELYMQAKEWERQRFYERAVKAYHACLEKDRYYPDALTGMAGIYIRRCLYTEAQELLLTALSIDTYHPQANYLHGIVNAITGDIADAKDGFSIACRSMEYRTAAYTELAKLQIRERQYNKALGYLEKALDYNVNNQQAIQLKIVVARLQGKADEASRAAEKQLSAYPLDHLTRFEQYLLGNISAFEFQHGIISEMPYEIYLELAAFYLDLHLYDNCMEMLSLSPGYVMVTLWQAYVAALQGSAQRDDQLLQEAVSMDPSFVFPHRQEDVRVLEWAVARERSWKLNYYLALAYVQMLRKAEALNLLIAFGNEPDHYVFYLVRAELRHEVNPAACEADLRLAHELASTDHRAVLALSRFLADHGRWAEAVKVVSVGHRAHPENYYLGLHHAACLMHTGKYVEGIDLMNRLKVLPNEGASDGRKVWRETHLNAAIKAMDEQNWEQALHYIGQARIWPEHMGIGRPYEVDERLEDLMAFLCIRQDGREVDTSDLIESIISYRDQHFDTPYSANDTAALYLLLQQQRTAQAHELLANWLSQDPQDLAGRWTEAFVKGDQDRLNAIGREEVPKRIPLPYEILFEDRSFAFIKKMYDRNWITMPAAIETNL